MSKFNEFINVTIPGDSSSSGMREKISIHYSQIIFQGSDLCFVNYKGNWVMPLEMNKDILEQIYKLD